MEKRKIKSIVVTGEYCYRLGESGIERIEAYEENGQIAPVRWFRIHRKAEGMLEVNGACVEYVCYFPEE